MRKINLTSLKKAFNEEIILGSSSPQRKDLLCKMNLRFKTLAPKCDESLVLKKNKIVSFKKTYSKKLLQVSREIVLSKYQSIFPSCKDKLTFCYDTVVLYKGMLLGKPKDLNEAKKMLLILSGEAHLILTTCLSVYEDWYEMRSYKTKVWFYNFDKKKIRNYLKKEFVLDAAGAYKIQLLGLSFVKKIKGCYFNILGLPLESLARFRS